MCVRVRECVCVSVCVCASVLSSLSLFMAGLWQQLSSLRRGLALALLHFILYLPSSVFAVDAKASQPSSEVSHLHEEKHALYSYRNVLGLF